MKLVHWTGMRCMSLHDSGRVVTPGSRFLPQGHMHTYAWRHNTDLEWRGGYQAYRCRRHSRRRVTPLVPGRCRLPCQANKTHPPHHPQSASHPVTLTYLVLCQVLRRGHDLLSSGRKGHAQMGSVEGRDRGQAEEKDGRQLRHRATHVYASCARARVVYVSLLTQARGSALEL